MATHNDTIDPVAVHGLDLSYFTGKIEAYLRTIGLAYRLEEMTTGSFQALAQRTGVRQMPQVELPDGTWLTDTPQIIDAMEARGGGLITPPDPACAFIAHALEDYGDEWLWRPALYYRWAFKADAELMSRRLAEGMLRDIPGPLFARKHFIRLRQQWTYLRKDGVTPRTAPAIEALYRSTLQSLELILSQRPFLLGARPTRADFGFFGGFFRHFFSDPTPATIMRATAPATMAWVARLWALSPDDISDCAFPVGVPGDLASIADAFSGRFLPYCLANEKAVAEGAVNVQWRDGEAAFTTPANGYRVWRLHRLREFWRALPDHARREVGGWLGERGARILDADNLCEIARPVGGGVVDRTWRKAESPA